MVTTKPKISPLQSQNSNLKFASSVSNSLYYIYTEIIKWQQVILELGIIILCGAAWEIQMKQALFLQGKKSEDWNG